MKLIFDYKFRFYTSKICLHCHLLYFSSIILNFGHCDPSLVHIKTHITIVIAQMFVYRDSKFIHKSFSAEVFTIEFFQIFKCIAGVIVIVCFSKITTFPMNFSSTFSGRCIDMTAFFIGLKEKKILGIFRLHVSCAASQAHVCLVSSRLRFRAKSLTAKVIVQIFYDLSWVTDIHNGEVTNFARLVIYWG